MTVAPNVEHTSDWTSFIWSKFTHNNTVRSNMILQWLANHPGGKYHINAKVNPAEIMFENKEDAAMFALRWS